MYDPDAPTGSGWWHWLVFNIPVNINGLPENASDKILSLMPQGAVQSINNADICGYEGPYPPIGDKAHAYIITIYALNIEKLGVRF